jgi:hypothetical protein
MEKEKSRIQSRKIELIHEGKDKAYSEDGVDLTLIRWMLSLIPTQRLENLQMNINNILRL